MSVTFLSVAYFVNYSYGMGVMVKDLAYITKLEVVGSRI